LPRPLDACFGCLSQPQIRTSRSTNDRDCAQPSDPKEWDPSDSGGWDHATCLISRRLPEFWADAGALSGDLKTRYAHIACFARDACLARFARFARYAPCGRNIPETQDEPLGFTVTCCALWRSLASAARLMEDILTPIPIDLKSLNPKS
jgi:hypothetical protein